MRAWQIFASMSPEQTVAFFRTLAAESPAAYAEALAAAATLQRLRPVYLRRLAPDQRAASIRRAFARVAANPVAEEMLAAYFLECRSELLEEWLDTVGLEHDEGVLKAIAPESPPRADLEKHVAAFRGRATPEDADDRELLLRAFAAQSAIDWPDLEALLADTG